MKKIKLTPSTTPEIKIRPATTRVLSPAIVASVLGAELVAEIPSHGSPLARGAAGDRLRAKIAPANEQIALWAHCVSEHAVILSPETTLAELRSYHAGEHRGPGTIRNHEPESRHYSLKKMGMVLSEADDAERES